MDEEGREGGWGWNEAGLKMSGAEVEDGLE